MNKLLVCLMGLITLGCSETVRINIVDLDKKITTPPKEETLKVVDEAFHDILGYERYITNDNWGTVKIDLINTDPHSGEYGGMSINSCHGCERVAWSTPEAENLAHEIGHIFCLEHFYDEGNLMNYPKTSDEEEVELLDWQRDIIEENIVKFNAECPDIEVY